MKSPKHAPLQLTTKVLFVFEGKKEAVKHNTTDTTTGTITLTGTGILPFREKKR